MSRVHWSNCHLTVEDNVTDYILTAAGGNGDWNDGGVTVDEWKEDGTAGNDGFDDAATTAAEYGGRVGDTNGAATAGGDFTCRR